MTYLRLHIVTFLAALLSAACTTSVAKERESVSAGNCGISYAKTPGIELISAGENPNWDAAQGGAQYGFAFTVMQADGPVVGEGSFYISCHPFDLQTLTARLFERRGSKLFLSAGAFGDFPVGVVGARHWRGLMVQHQMSSGACDLIIGPAGEDASFEISICSLGDDSFMLGPVIKDFIFDMEMYSRE